jgi:ATP-binding cassette subfamily C (CFTR/MRP) protein 1
MVTHPANMIMTILPRAIASLASFQRIQDFVSKPHFRDTRLPLERAAGATSMEVAVALKDVELRLTESTTPTLQNIDLRIKSDSIVACTGFTGVGKSILGLAITGEITPSKGSVSTISKRTGLCAQSPWLPGQSISETIQGFSGISAPRDDAWYQQVLDACCIDDDILLNPAARDTAKGHARLSGGQRQRVALARAVYQRHDILVLDDPFSALDQGTQDRVIFNLLGPDGLLRKSHTTVFLITNATRAYSLADRILLLKDSRIQFDGDYSSYQR